MLDWCVYAKEYVMTTSNEDGCYQHGKCVD